MRLQPASVDPTALLRPTTVATRMNVHPSMVTHWMASESLDYVEIDGQKFIPEASVALLEAMRTEAAKPASVG